jgi:hypothetical protein
MPIFKEPTRKLSHTRKLTLKGEGYGLLFWNNHVEVAKSPSLDIRNGITMEVLCKFLVGLKQNIWSILIERGYPVVYMIAHNFDTNATRFQVISNDISYYSDYSWKPLMNTAYMFSLTYDLSLIKGYINAEFKKSLKNTDPIDISNNPLYIGKRLIPNAKYPLYGIISLVRIYKDLALTEEELKWNLKNPLNPVHKSDIVLWLDWTSVDVENNVWEDKSGYGNDGVINGATPIEARIYVDEDNLQPYIARK